jgi:AcrR family transcriptional regulator
VQAGVRAFARKGLAGTNLTLDILAPAGVSVGSFYHQFRDKTALLLAILGEHSLRFRERLSELHRPGPGRTLDEIVTASYRLVLDVAERDGDVMRIKIRERNNQDPRVRRFLADDRARWLESLAEDHARIAQASGALIDSERAAELVVALAFGSIDRFLELDPGARRRELPALLEGLVRFTLGGLPGLTQPRQERPSHPSDRDTRDDRDEESPR